MTHPTPPGDPVTPDPLFTAVWAPPSDAASPVYPQPAPPIYPVPGPGLPPPPTAALPGFPAYDPYAPAGPYGSPAYPPSSPYAFGQPASYPSGYGVPYGYAGFAPPARTEGLAIASLVVSCVSVAGLCVWGFASVLGILGAIFGHVARSRIRRSGARGKGMALAGIIVGWTSAAIGLLTFGLFITLAVTDGFQF